MSFIQEAGQNYNAKITNKSFENLAKFKYLGKAITNKNCIDEEINSVLFTIQFRNFFVFPSPNTEIKICILIILCNCMGSFSILGENRLRVLEKTVLRWIFKPKREKVRRGWRKMHNEKARISYSSTDIITIIKSRRLS